ncbi:MAG: Stk1 family PASTA domain-containing Ser/Thr kinase [Clostridia bacterium]|nr:Stk1 family PASTA domain-containing Ser/Thr kinase [Clostridia bacterium]
MDLVGKLLGNRYEVIEKVGDGGMATVYKSRDKILNRKVAIKVLKDEFSNDQEFIKRFQIEAQSAASLSHPNIVSIYDVANDGDIHYIVMELIEGRTLKELIKENGKLEWKDAVEIASQIASGLTQAHKNHIIHRDIKPHNIIMTKDKIAKITDFGIAKAVTSSTINASVSTLGSVHYFSPEHARGGYTDEKSDIYSLGVVLYEMITGKLPFDSDTPISVALKHLQEKATPPIELSKDIPMGLNDIIMKAMQKEVSERYASASEMYNDLQQILKSPNSLNVGGVKNMDDKKYATQKVPVIGANSRVTRESSENRVDSDYMGKTKKKKRTKKQAILRLFIYILLAFAIIALSAFATTKLLGGAFGEDNDIQVPLLEGNHKDEALKTLEALGLKMEIQANVISNEWPKDYIVSQTYDEGYRLKPGATVGVTVSKGAKQILVPDVTIMSVEAAKIEIEKNGLKFDTKEEASSLVPEGEIVRQDPVFNTEIGEGETVTVYISTGSPDGIVEVPNIMSYGELQARDVITKANLIPVVKYAEKIGEPEGKILGQTPEAGAQVSELTEITIIINKFETTEPDDDKNVNNGNNNSNNNSNNNNNNHNNNNTNNNAGSNVEDVNYITIDLSNKGVRETFSVRVELQGDITGKKILHEATHKRSDGRIQVAVSKNATGLIRVYIDGEIDSEMVI